MHFQVKLFAPSIARNVPSTWPGYKCVGVGGFILGERVFAFTFKMQIKVAFSACQMTRNCLLNKWTKCRLTVN